MRNDIASPTVGELLTEPVVVDAADPVSRAIGLLRRLNAYEVFVIESRKVMGVVTIRDILKASNIAGMKISTLIGRVPQVTRGDSLGKAARIMTEHRVRALPVLDDGKLVGQLTASSICDHICRTGRLHLAASSIMTSDPISLREDDQTAKARTVMIQRNIDHLPVVRQQEIVGMLTSDAIVFRMTPPERIAWESIVAEEQRRLDVRVSGLMSGDPVISPPDADVAQVIGQMKKRGTAYSLVALWGELQGIITYRDCVRLLAAPSEETLPISIVGLPDDPFEAEAAKAKFQKVVKRLAKGFPDLLEARSVIKTSRKTGERHRYEVEVELITSRKRRSFNESGWSLPEIYDELSDRMKRLTTKKSERPKRRLE